MLLYTDATNDRKIELHAFYVAFTVRGKHFLAGMMQTQNLGFLSDAGGTTVLATGDEIGAAMVFDCDTTPMAGVTRLIIRAISSFGCYCYVEPTCFTIIEGGDRETFTIKDAGARALHVAKVSCEEYDYDKWMGLALSDAPTRECHTFPESLGRSQELLDTLAEICENARHTIGQRED